MLSKTDLEKYKNRESIREALERELNCLRENPPIEALKCDRVKGSQGEFPYCQRTFAIREIDEIETKTREAKYKELKAMYDEKVARQRESEINFICFVNAIMDSKKKLVVLDIYDSGMTQREAARKHNYSQPRIAQIIDECLDEYNRLHE